MTLLHLGDGLAAGRGISAKAALLDQLAHAGIRVPAGVIIPDSKSIPTWEALQLRCPVVVRSAFGAEDGSMSARAGQFESVLHVTEQNYIDAYEIVINSADRVLGAFRRDVLVMEQVNAQHAGVAFSERGWLDDIVNVTGGLADGLVSGEVEGERLELSRLGTRLGEAGWQTRLREVLVQVRKVLGDQAWDIEWADDGVTCWLVQTRPITVPLRRNEALTSANHKEILPDLPSPFMASIVGSCADQLFGWYRQFDKRLPSIRPMIEVVSGRPFLNLSLLEDMLRLWGLPSRLIADSFGGQPIHDEPFNRHRFARSLLPLARQGLAQIRAVLRPARLRSELPALVSRPGSTVTEQVESARRAYVMMVTGMMPLSSFISGPVSALRRAGTLGFHAQRHETISTRMARARSDQLLQEFGHRGVYESDLARPRFADDPNSVVNHVGSTVAPRSNKWTFKAIATLPIWLIVKPAITARENHRHECMRAFHSIRKALVQSANACVDAGQLRLVNDLWLLTGEEATKLDSGWHPDAQFWTDREQQQTINAQLDPPDVIGRFDDPATWMHHDDVSAVTSWSGIPLTSGIVRGVAWVLSEPSAVVPTDLNQPIVLIARSIDAGWAITFPLVDGVAVETGGDLSHGSIVLRELGKPAATNLRSITRGIKTGDTVELDAMRGLVTLR